MTSITSSSGFVYDLTEDDLLWLARAAKYEGGNEIATIWTLAQRYVWLKEGGTRGYPTFASMIRAFAQPINPKWMRDGEFCRPGGTWYDRCNGSYCPCEERRLDVRDRAVADPVPGQLELVHRWANGNIPNPVPRAINYAAPFVIEDDFERGDLFPILTNDRDNWYGGDQRSMTWDPNHVRVNGTGAGGSSALWIGLGLGGAALLGVAWFFSSRR